MSYEVQFEPDPSGVWDRLPESAWDVGGSGGVTCTDCFLKGHGSPEGVLTGDFQGQPYADLDTGGVYVFIGTAGTNTGWV